MKQERNNVFSGLIIDLTQLRKGLIKLEKGQIKLENNRTVHSGRIILTSLLVCIQDHRRQETQVCRDNAWEEAKVSSRCHTADLPQRIPR